MTTKRQAAQQKLVEQFEKSAKRAEELAAHARQLAAFFKNNLENYILSKGDLEDWRASAFRIERNAKFFTGRLEMDVEETINFLDQQIKEKQ